MTTSAARTALTALGAVLTAAACAAPEADGPAGPPYSVAGPAEAPVIVVNGPFPTVPDVVDLMEATPALEDARENWETSWGSYNASGRRSGARTFVSNQAPDSVAAVITREGLEALAWLVPDSVITGMPSELAVPAFQARRVLLEARGFLEIDRPRTALISYLTAADRLLEQTPRGKALYLRWAVGQKLTLLEARGNPANAERIAQARADLQEIDERMGDEDYLSVIGPILTISQLLDGPAPE